MKVLVIAAHPDDEVLGCGGTLARHAAEGDEVHVLFLADGESARGADGTAIAQRRDMACRAARALGTHPPRFLGLADNRLDGMDLLDIVQPIEAVIAELAPTRVYTHHGGDLNIDHRRAHQATLTACRPQPGTPVCGLYAFEVPSSTEWAGPGPTPFVPTRFVDITGHLTAKATALAAYNAELRRFPHARSTEGLEALARWRGVSAGLGAAEAFMVIREIEK